MTPPAPASLTKSWPATAVLPLSRKSALARSWKILIGDWRSELTKMFSRISPARGASRNAWMFSIASWRSIPRSKISCAWVNSPRNWAIARRLRHVSCGLRVSPKRPGPMPGRGSNARIQKVRRTLKLYWPTARVCWRKAKSGLRSSFLSLTFRLVMRPWSCKRATPRPYWRRTASSMPSPWSGSSLNRIPAVSIR